MVKAPEHFKEDSSEASSQEEGSCVPKGGSSVRNLTKLSSGNHRVDSFLHWYKAERFE